MQSFGNGKYEIIERLGRGGMAEVYRAYQSNLDRFVAVKVLHPFLADDPEFKSRFEKEARNIAKLKHPNIVTVYDFENDAESESYYMVMELIEGPTLKEVMASLTDEGQLMPVPEVIRIIRESAAALSFAHGLNMIHRDVKPANLMLEKNHRVVLTDFGIAKIVTGVQFTSSGGMVGTPAYMAPEQGLGEQGDDRSDLYSLGVIFYQLLTGRLPYDGDTPLAVILKHLNEPVRSVREYRPELPETLDQIVMRLMAKDPVDRYQTATELIADLDRFERGASDLDTGSFQGVPASALVGETDTLALPKYQTGGRTPPGGLRVTDTGSAMRRQPPTQLASKPAPHMITEQAAVQRRRGVPIWLWVAFSILVGAGIFAAVFGGLGGNVLDVLRGTIAAPTATEAALIGVDMSATPTPTETPAPPTATYTPSATATPAPTQTPDVVIITATPLPPSNTPRPQPTNTPAPPTPTRRPTLTLTPSNTPTATITLTPTVNFTATVEQVNLALTVQAMTLEACIYGYEVVSSTLIVDGVRYADNRFLQAGTAFTMEIILRNTGTCAWERNSSMRYQSGEFYDGEQTIFFDRRVTVQDTYTVLFAGRAPTENGVVTGLYQLRTARDFVIGAEPLAITIEVFGG